MAQELKLKAPVAFPEDQLWFSATTSGGCNSTSRGSKVIVRLLHACGAHACAHTHTQIHTHINKIEIRIFKLKLTSGVRKPEGNLS